MDKTRKSLVAAVLAGALVVPSVAFIAGASNGTSQPQEGPAIANALPARVGGSAEKGAGTTQGAVSEPSDLQLACGADGAALVAGERAGILTPVEEAALDALRDICDEAGMPLDPAPAGSVVTEVVVVEAAAALPAPDAGRSFEPGSDHDDDYYDDDYGDGYGDDYDEDDSDDEDDDYDEDDSDDEDYSDDEDDD